MRILVDLRSHLSDPDPAPEIIQVQKVPPIGVAEPINGKYVIPTPLDVDFHIDEFSHILDGAGNVDSTAVSSQAFAHLLAALPQYRNIYFNPLLTSDHVAELVLDQSDHFTDKTVSPAATYYPRFQTGREDGVPDDGQMPTHTALMPQNNGVTPARPGLIITEEIDIGPFTLDCDGNQVGADEFAVYWKLYAFDVTEDINASAGALAGQNTPALRRIYETAQEPTGFSVYLSTDGGANWCPVGLLENVAFCDKSKRIKLAFLNESASKVFLACYAVLF